MQKTDMKNSHRRRQNKDVYKRQLYNHSEQKGQVKKLIIINKYNSLSQKKPIIINNKQTQYEQSMIMPQCNDID